MSAKKALTATVICLLAACHPQEEVVQEPQTPEQMYQRVLELLQPNVEHDASDFGQAMEWLHQAAEAGHRQAQTDLGGIYLEGGKGDVKADGKKAFYWFQKAAEQGSKEALYYMGLLLYEGKDMPRDYAQAMRYWQQAAMAGVAEAQLSLGLEFAKAQDASAVQQGVKWLTSAVEHRTAAPSTSAKAACALGYIYATAGHAGITRNMAEAAKWYQIAADGGDVSAQYVYALMLLQGEPIAKDEKKGMSYLRLAAGRDHPAAIQLLIKLLSSEENASTHTQEVQAWAKRLETLQKKAAAPTEAQTAHE